MPYLILGLLFLIFGIYFRKRAHHEHNHHGVDGMTFIIVAALILILFFGIFDRMNIL